MAVSQVKASMKRDHLPTATEEVTAVALASTADPEVAVIARRRQFSASERQRILAAADRCSQAGEIGALLRREGIYSSQLAAWRKRRVASEHAALAPHKRGRKADPAVAQARREAELIREIEGLRGKLAQAHTIIDVQKKLCTLLGLPTAEEPESKS
jgi:transposase